MTAGRYSFIDIAVLEEVRVDFAAGKALVLLSVDLDEVLWANGAGAALFGHGDVESVMGASPDLGFVARRQIAAVPGFPRMGRDRPVTIRLARGTASRAVPFSVSAVTLPDGVPAVLLVTMTDNDDTAAARIVTGFKEAGYFAALIDSQAQIQAMSDGFAALGISQDTLARLVAEVAHEHDRLVKRLIPARNGLVPAGIARLVDDPSLHLMIAVDEPIEEIAPADEEDAPSSMEVFRQASELAAPSDADLPERVTEEIFSGSPSVIAPPDNDSDDWYFDHADEPTIEGDAAGAIQPSARAPVDLTAGPVRFSWRTDARGTISALSREFIDAIGPDTGDVVGQPLHQVMVKFSLDPQDEIARLLERRDTWSGRTVMWPISGTKLVVPVDLAALPVYDRDRVFEGFRGFGVVRMGDATSDPHERGLNVDSPSEQPLSDEAPASNSDSLEAPTDPFRNEAPAITITQQAKRRISDRVIQLAEHRPPQPEPDRPDEVTPLPKHRLSAVERSAFEEIRERLQRETSAATRIEPEVSQKEAQAGEEAVENAAPVSAAVDDGQEPVPVPVAVDSETPEAIEPDNDVTPLLEADDSERRTVIAPEVIAALPLPLLVHAGDMLHFANREFFELTGYASLDEISREGGLDRLFVDEPPQEPGEAEGHKLWLRTSDGETFPVEAHLQSIGWQDGTALLLALQRVAAPAQQPVPAPELADDELADDEPKGDQPGRLPGELEQHLAELRTIIDTATDGVVLIAPDGTIRNISHPAEALFGFDSAEVEGSHFVTLLAIESRKTARDYLASLAENGVASLLNDGREVIGREREGRFIPLFMTIGRLPGDSGYCAVVRDITHFKRAEEEMTQARAQAERASLQKSEFLARVSHEIRTPLNAIIGFSELMMDEKFGPIGSDRYRDYLRDINRSGNHVLDLVNDLLDISKIEAGEQEMNYEAVSLNEALAEVVAMMQPQANRERVIIRSSLATSLPEIVADLRSVRQIALNLLSNAIRYTHAGGQVIVSTAYEFNGEVALRVRDTGIGMTLAEIDQALKPFKQINALKRGRHDGTGLGLPLTKAMVEANRARFAISSTPGEGTLVEIVFPSTRVLAG